MNYSATLYEDQGYELINKDLQKELIIFLKDRFKYYLKEKEIQVTTHLLTKVTFQFLPSD